MADVPGVLGNWTAGRGPLHRKLTDALRAAIVGGDLAPGAKLPPERVLAAQLAVSRSTVVAALDRLRSEALLVSRQGSGTRVAADVRRPVGDGTVPGGRGQAVFRRLVEGPGAVISLACAIPSCLPAVVEAAAALTATDLAVPTGRTGYHPLGLPELRQELADLHTREGVPTGPEQILVTTGAQQAINLAAALFVRPGDTVIVESPGFPGVLDVFRAAGARLLTVEVDGEGARVDQVDHLARRTPVAAVFVMPSFHNPVGVAMSEPRRRRLASLSAELGLPVIEDNAMEHARLGMVPPPSVGATGEGPVVTIGSVSKVLWGGLRLGWVRASEELVNRLVRLKVLHDLGTGVMGQLVVARLLPRFEALRAERQVDLLDSLENMTSLLGRHLPGWRWNPPQGGPSLWVRIPWGDTDTFGQITLRHGVEIVPGSTMSPDGAHRDHLRVPFVFDRAASEALVERLAAAWRAYAPSDRSDQGHLSVVV
ncbi:MAG TPA: PLP-dependent aminotransferase family protein [Acidimicrobiales bacterium]|nr:PLP-dependent aminotransferase family protein [Acidimicrobiales bacterium]